MCVRMLTVSSSCKAVENASTAESKLALSWELLKCLGTRVSHSSRLSLLMKTIQYSRSS